MRDRCPGRDQAAQQLIVAACRLRPVDLPHRAVERPDVGLAQVSELDVTDARSEVQPDRLGVAVERARLQRGALVFEPSGEVLPDRHLPVAGVPGLDLAAGLVECVLALLLGRVRPDPRLPALAAGVGRGLVPGIPGAVILLPDLRALLPE
jgi:hypothetical protein